jgi:hypothetical protein
MTRVLLISITDGNEIVPGKGKLAHGGDAIVMLCTLQSMGYERALAHSSNIMGVVFKLICDA